MEDEEPDDGTSREALNEELQELKEALTKQGQIGMLRRSNFNGSRSKIVNLLLITYRENRHYTTVKNMSRLLTSMNSKHRDIHHYCLNCLQGFHSIESRDKHYECCIDHEAVKIEMPKEKDKWLKYHEGQKQLRVPFIIYADFESILTARPVKPRASNDPEKSSIEKINTHIPSGWCTYSKFVYGDVPDPLMVYRGKSCTNQFIEHLESEVKRLYDIFPEQPMIPLTEVLQREYSEAIECHICLKPFDDPVNNRRVRDHCHYTGLYRGAAHNNCNLKYKTPNHIPIVFHNLSGYDAHLFIRELGKKFNKDDIGVIAENKEKYISFNVKIDVKLAGVTKKDGTPVYKKVHLRFIDSCRFMPSSLDSLSQNLSDNQCKNLHSFYREEDVFQLMRRNGVYPYEYMDNWSRFEETRLPPKEAFYSKLKMEGISNKDYEHAQRV